MKTEKTTHTPGPWKWCAIRRSLNGPRDEDHVLTTTTSGISESDARLIAAAPALLEACRAAESQMTADGYELAHVGGKALADLRAAIAQAEGGAA